MVARCNVRVSQGAFGEECQDWNGQPQNGLDVFVQLLRIQMISQNDVKFDVNMFEQTIFLVSCDMNLIHAITSGWHAWILHTILCVGSFRVKNLYGQGL